ncbi:transposase family protein [Microbispora siamensis]
MEAACPDCGIRSRRRHSHYERRLSDTAVGGQELLIHLRVNRFSCRNATCARATFAEQMPSGAFLAPMPNELPSRRGAASRVGQCPAVAGVGDAALEPAVDRNVERRC